MGREYPKPFHMKDLFIDVKLEAIVNGNTFDFLGRKIFTAEFFRQGVGFGIINIDIEVNTSLQPLVVVTFKDLYGLTVFGGQERRPPGYDGDKYFSHDFSVIFDWPPPKFLFSFKGYLGKPVSWVLNLKKTSTSFNSSDGSYELKCEFVPNQWGIFADLPMLFLLASKALRRERYGSNPTPEQQKLITSVFDLIKIGKQVEVKTKETTKEFDDLIKQLGSLKSNISNTLVDSRILKFGSIIDGVVNNIKVKDFVPIAIPALAGLSPVDTEEKMNLKISNVSSTAKLNTFLLLKLTFDGKVPYDSKETGSVDYNSLNVNNDKIDKAKNQVIEAINKNIRFVEDEIKRRVYNSSKSKLQKITISQIFSQLGRDAAFIIGSILEVGLEGYKKFPNRDDYPGRLIGQSFPLVIKDGEEVPATTANFSVDIGVDENEMNFVRKFINAISEGIAKDLLKDDASNLSEDNTLKNRVNNAEIAKGNPYKPFYKDIATNILVRGGIVGHVTRGSDPNRPGDYGNTTIWDNDSPGDIIELAKREIQNIKPKLSQLSDTDLYLLRRFCRFIIKFYGPTGENLLKDDGTGKLVKGELINSPDQAEEPVEVEEGVKTTFAQLFKELSNDNVPINEVPVSDDSVSEDQSIISKQALSFISETSYTAQKIINNGIAYTITLNTEDDYYMIVFEGEDNKKAQEANSSPTDIEYRDEEKDDPDFGQDEPLGYVAINQVKDVEDESEDAGRVKTIYKKAKQFKAIDYSKLKNPLSSFYDNSVSSGFNNYLWDKTIYDSKEEALAANAEPDSYAIAGDVGYTILSNFNGEGQNVFDMFSAEAPGINQRVFIWRACKDTLDEIGKLQEEKNQVVGAVLGKAAEQEVGLYKQMHTLFHQWQSLVYSSNQSFVEEKGLIERLESAYGGSHDNLKESPKGKLVDKDGNGIPDGAFVYDFPLQRINGEGKGKPVQVKNSIINLEPLYKINGETSVLNIIQQVCTKNNFLFVPIPGNATYLSVDDLYSPSQLTAGIDVKNFFHVLFTPTPESRSKNRNGGTSLSLSKNHKEYSTNSFVIRYGHPDNEIVSNVQIDTDEVKNTAESIVNLQRLVDNENQNKVVTTDCSTLPVLQGRSYKMTVDMLGNAQVYPMQFMFLENSPMFGGLYQVMSVKHSITPNDMKTSVGGIRMRFAGDYGGIYPVTLDTFENLGSVLAPEAFTKDEKEKIKNYNQSPNGIKGSIKEVKDWSNSKSSGTGVSKKGKLIDGISCPRIDFKLSNPSKKTLDFDAVSIAKRVFPELSLKAISAILGHISVESTLNPTAYNNTQGGCGALGIAQWRGDRLSNLAEFAKKKNKNLDDFETQLLFMKKELTSEYLNVYSILQKPKLSIIQYLSVIHMSYGLGNSNPYEYYKKIDSLEVYIPIYVDKGGRAVDVIPKRLGNSNHFYEVAIG